MLKGRSATMNIQNRTRSRNVPDVQNIGITPWKTCEPKWFDAQMEDRAILCRFPGWADVLGFAIVENVWLYRSASALHAIEVGSAHGCNFWSRA